ncbi:RapZ C-terminal domain-containing protein [Chryseobacterium sp. 2TAF14]|uniref:RapZ C-terminal domain-containing protein n=1 Tax=Chryseobacterium sp. 2TAF14 TaxID=3233007 RepID=UPI003F9097C0
MLHIDIHSFSYKKGGIPKDDSGNGGGFTFDCRGILNPGRVEEYKIQTGKDIGVQEYLETKTDMPKFLELIKSLVSINIDNYLRRGFENLQINFGPLINYKNEGINFCSRKRNPFKTFYRSSS